MSLCLSLSMSLSLHIMSLSPLTVHFISSHLTIPPFSIHILSSTLTLLLHLNSLFMNLTIPRSSSFSDLGTKSGHMCFQFQA